MMVIVLMTTASLSPNEYGVLLNTFSGQLEGEAVRGGLRGRAPWKSYVKFPATQVSVVWSKADGDDENPIIPNAPPITARAVQNGGEGDMIDTSGDEQASGQPVYISCSMQFLYKQEYLQQVYKKFKSHEMAVARYQILAKNRIVATAQGFAPEDFWKKRREIADVMLKQINDELDKYWVKVVYFEILKIEFTAQFEENIVKTQVADQKTIVNTYSQKVQTVLKSIDVLNAKNQAKIAAILATADKRKKEMMANATQNVFKLKQTTKAESYRRIKEMAHFSTDQMKEYVKIKALLSQSSNGAVVINVPQPEDTCDAKGCK